VINLIPCFPDPRTTAIKINVIGIGLEGSEHEGAVVLSNITLKVVCPRGLIFKKGADGVVVPVKGRGQPCHDDNSERRSERSVTLRHVLHTNVLHRKSSKGHPFNRMTVQKRSLSMGVMQAANWIDLMGQMVRKEREGRMGDILGALACD
jgi:hypothetical protein